MDRRLGACHCSSLALYSTYGGRGRKEKASLKSHGCRYVCIVYSTTLKNLPYPQDSGAPTSRPACAACQSRPDYAQGHWCLDEIFWEELMLVELRNLRPGLWQIVLAVDRPLPHTHTSSVYQNKIQLRPKECGDEEPEPQIETVEFLEFLPSLTQLPTC